MLSFQGKKAGHRANFFFLPKEYFCEVNHQSGNFNQWEYAQPVIRELFHILRNLRCLTLLELISNPVIFFPFRVTSKLPIHQLSLVI